MTGLNRALKAFWSQFSYAGSPVAAYLSGRVPNGAEYPYITFESVDADFGGMNVLTAFVWAKADYSGDSTVTEVLADILGQIKHAIPHEGVLIGIEGEGGAVLYRNDTEFQSYVDESTDTISATVRGGRTSYIVRYYNV